MDRMLRDKQYSCMHLITVYWTLFMSASMWYPFHLDCILQKVDILLNCPNNYRYPGMGALSHEFSFKSLGNRSGKTKK